MTPKPQYKSGKFYWTFLLPRYWGIWIAFAFLFLMSLLPWSIQWRIARVLAKLAWKGLSSRRKTTIRNLEVCFPEKSQAEIQAQAQQVFFDMMLGLFEALNAWYAPKWFRNRVHVHGLEHLQKAKGKGILLLGTHTTLLDAGGFVSSLFFDLDVVYRPQNNPMLDWMIYNCRARVYKNQIARDDMRGFISHLKNGRAIWYSPDQDFGLKQGVMAPFFGIPAATLTAHRRLIKITQAIAIPLYFYRDGTVQNPQYHVLVEPPVENFPTTDEVEDATRINRIIENQLRIAPTQYMWFHRRFKTRPEGVEKVY